eukprot:scaffold81188_cov75-Phaeocystis_antarctica.AAC.1
MSDGSLAQPKQARLSATLGGAPPLSAAGGVTAAAEACRAEAAWALLSAFSALSASRTSLVPAPRSGCCSRSLASSGLGPRSGSATCSPRTASRRASDVQVSHMRPPCVAASLKLHSSTLSSLRSLRVYSAT